MADFLSKTSTTAATTITGLMGAAAYYWATSDPAGIKVDLASLEMQSVLVPEEGACCRASPSREKFLAKLDALGVTTPYETFIKSVNKRKNSKCLGWRSSPQTGYDNWLTYGETLEKVTDVGCGLRYLGLEAKNDTYIGMFSINKPEVVLTQLACYQHSMVLVPMYSTLGPEALAHMVKQTGMEVVICEDESKVEKLVELSTESTANVKSIISLKPVSEELQKKVEARGWRYMTFTELEKHGRANPVPMNLAKPKDVAFICYTSGTTGVPKGAMIEHGNMLNAVLAVFFRLEEALGQEVLDEGEEVHISYLPLAHMYEQIILHGMLRYGGAIGFYSGDVKLLMSDIQTLRPTIFASVPRLLTKIYDKVLAAVAQSSVKSYLFHKALEKKAEYYKRGIITKSTLWDKLVFKKLQDSLGGRVKFITTGAAPIAPQILRFLRLAFGAAVTEGYGQTECTGVMSVSSPGDDHDGECGGPLASTVIKLVDVPEMGYLSENNEGEVCCKGTVFRGYLHDEGKTKEAIDEDGWLHTGDIGRWTPRGTLQIVDRKKNLFKLSQGEYVAPEKVENVYSNSSLVAQSFIYGNSLKSSLVGIVVPDPDILPGYAKSKLNIDPGSLDMVTLCAREDVKKAILEDMVRIGKELKLSSFEQVRDICLTPEPFSVENNLLTPTFKLKRHEAKIYFKTNIDDMYLLLE